MATSDMIKVTRSSDNLLRPEKWVSEIHQYPDGHVEYAVQFVGRDEGVPAIWHSVKTVREARKAIKLEVSKNDKEI